MSDIITIAVVIVFLLLVPMRATHMIATGQWVYGRIAIAWASSSAALTILGVWWVVSHDVGLVQFLILLLVCFTAIRAGEFAPYLLPERMTRGRTSE